MRSRCLNEFFLLARMQSGMASLILSLLAEKQKSIRHPQKPENNAVNGVTNASDCHSHCWSSALFAKGAEQFDSR